MSVKQNQLRMIRIAKYLGENELYNEAYSIKKIALEGMSDDTALVKLEDDNSEDKKELTDEEKKDKIVKAIDRVKHMVRTNLDLLVNLYFTFSLTKYIPFLSDFLAIFYAVCDDSIDLTKRAIIALCTIALMGGGEVVLGILAALMGPAAPLVFGGGTAILIKIIISLGKTITTDEHRSKARRFLRKDRSIWDSLTDANKAYWANEEDMEKFERTQPGYTSTPRSPTEISNEKQLVEDLKDQGIISEETQKKLTDKEMTDIVVASALLNLQIKVAQILNDDNIILKHSYSY